MSDPAPHGPAHAERLPILTEVVEIGSVGRAPPAVSMRIYPDPAVLVEQVMAQVARQVDAGFEAQLRGALAPAVARAVGTLLAEGRVALSASLRVLVEQAVARALAEHRDDRS